MASEIQRQENGTIQLTITIPVEDVKKVEEQVLEDLVKNAALPGFRKGKAPKKLVEEKLDKAKTQEEILKKLLPQAYVKAVEEHNLRPVMNPKIHIEKIESGKPWQFIALICEAPKVELGVYKDAVQKITAKQKIIIPGKEDEKKEVKFEEIMQAVLDTAKIELPQLIVDNEVERMLANLLDDIKRLGLSLDQYLSSTQRSAESLREEYQKKAVNDLKIEFVLQKIAEMEKITVSDTEIQEAILNAKTDSERANLESNRYLLASILRQQKTLDFLRNL